MHKEYQHMMEEVTLSPAARAAIESKLSAVPKAGKHRRSPLRMVITAACLCLLVPMTVLGVEQLWNPVSIGEQVSNTEESSYKIVADVALWSEESFSDALQEDLANRTLQRVHNDKDALEEYLGFSLISSPALEEASLVMDLDEHIAYGWDLRPQLMVDTSARYILTASDLEGNDVETDPEVLKVSGHRVMENSEIYLDAWIIMDSVTQTQLEEGVLGEIFLPVHMLYSQWVVDDEGKIVLDSNGSPKVTEYQYASAEQAFSYSSYPMANGDTATIITAQQVECDGSLGFREYMGYFIHDGILYTVKPYGIYDPSKNYPMNDYDMLEILKVVLDTFA